VASLLGALNKKIFNGLNQGSGQYKERTAFLPVRETVLFRKALGTARSDSSSGWTIEKATVRFVGHAI
jgi:hypothetical protein